MKWTPDTVIGMVIVIGCLILLALRIDSEVKSVLAMAAGWCFGAQYQARKLK